MKRALVFSLICVLGVAFTGFAASLSGSWDTDVTIDPQQTNFSVAIGLTSVLTVAYTIGDWTFTSVTDLDDGGWTDQDFTVAGVLGAFTLTSALDFTPAPAPAFGSWNTTVSVSIAGVSFGADFTLEDNSVALILSGSGVAGDVTVAVEVTFGEVEVEVGVCDLNWTGITINLGFPFCCADVAVEIAFDCDGFDYIEFTAGAIAIPNLPWLTLDIEVLFTLNDKQFTFSPNFSFGDIVCFDLEIDVATTGGVQAPLVIGDISIVGISLECDIGAVTFTAVTDFSADAGDYFEWYGIETNDDACCGPFGFDLTFYFLDGGLALFEIALIDANMTLQVATQFTFNMGLEVNVDSGAFTQWTVGFLVTW
ncbi:hypothetical protein KAJ02_02825 [Candidatus Bipolaricaulota bacterium]|nr:hypothetical protein [Candidatus Bipolaricaulota bacterium]